MGKSKTTTDETKVQDPAVNNTAAQTTQAQAPEVQTPEVQTPEVQEATVKEEERVEIYIEKGYANDDPNLFVGLNGVNYVLPKGETSVVPKSVADEIERSRRATRVQDKNIDAMKAKASK